MNVRSKVRLDHVVRFVVVVLPVPEVPVMAVAFVPEVPVAVVVV